MDHLHVCVICGRVDIPANLGNPDEPVEHRPDPVNRPIPFELWVERNPHPGFAEDNLEPIELAVLVLDNDILRYSEYLKTLGLHEEEFYFKRYGRFWLERTQEIRCSTTGAGGPDSMRKTLNDWGSKDFEARNPPPMSDAEMEALDLRLKLEAISAKLRSAEARSENAEKLVAALNRAREAQSERKEQEDSA